jgi:propanediol dehydratase large subunit
MQVIVQDSVIEYVYFEGRGLVYLNVWCIVIRNAEYVTVGKNASIRREER